MAINGGATQRMIPQHANSLQNKSGRGDGGGGMAETKWAAWEDFNDQRVGFRAQTTSRELKKKKNGTKRVNQAIDRPTMIGPFSTVPERKIKTTNKRERQESNQLRHAPIKAEKITK